MYVKLRNQSIVIGLTERIVSAHSSVPVPRGSRCTVFFSNPVHAHPNFRASSCPFSPFGAIVKTCDQEVPVRLPTLHFYVTMTVARG